MGTRGAIGFYINGQTKVAYNHFDSYPDAVGHDVVEFIQETFEKLGPSEALAWLRQKATEFQETKTDAPTPDDIVRFAKYARQRNGNDSNVEWYDLLRHAQGKLGMILEAGVYECARYFLDDGLFCEHAYIVNLDEETLEYYEGFFKYKPRVGPSERGRYWKEDASGKEDYGPIVLLETFKLSEITEPQVVIERMKAVRAEKAKEPDMADNLNWTQIDNSSNIKAIAYDEATKTAYVEFNNGSKHSYADVPQNVFEGFSSAESKGSYFNENIKSAFTSSKL